MRASARPEERRAVPRRPTRGDSENVEGQAKIIEEARPAILPRMTKHTAAFFVGLLLCPTFTLAALQAPIGVDCGDSSACRELQGQFSALQHQHHALQIKHDAVVDERDAAHAVIRGLPHRTKKDQGSGAV